MKTGSNYMLNYKSISDLSAIISVNLSCLPTDIDLVVGVPRSGMLPASIISLYRNIPFTDVYSYADNRYLKYGSTRKIKKLLELCSDAEHILIVDDSISTGESLKKIKDIIDYCSHKKKVTYCCIYGVDKISSFSDFIFEIVPLPRVFEWNIFHHSVINTTCFDIDGVLCEDPTQEQNDDGSRYKDFILNAKPLFVPTQKIRCLVTSRLEKYRNETIQWLKMHNIKYDKLHMLDLPDAETRRRLGIHSKFKASIYSKDIASNLFIESELKQAIDIANRSGKSVFCTENMTMVFPGSDLKSSINQQKAKMKYFFHRLSRLIKRKLYN